MAFPRYFLRQTLLWNLADGEVASCSVAWDGLDGAPTEVPEDLNTALDAKADTFWTDCKIQFGPNTKYVGNRVALISPAGLTVHTIDNSSAPDAGTNGADTLPTEVAVCISLISAVYARSGRGRIFLPPTSTATVSASGRLAEGARDDIADAAEDYFFPATVGSVTLVPAIASKSTQLLREVKVIRVGDVFDVQRRRRDALTEVSSVRTLE